MKPETEAEPQGELHLGVQCAPFGRVRSYPTIKFAREVCEHTKARAAIVITLRDGAWGGASYGETRAICRMTGRFLDDIFDGVLKAARDIEPEPPA